ncbi:hypothetical protein OIU84_019782 [Salix udensis]|uniref:Uncharacterized protein n=1 Tax=Salix udensis TaxID=889485 RepID=A0AAD6PK07_9ROSI|nr:hypothetical protein OIU84_019782 [Salix udensis]
MKKELRGKIREDVRGLHHNLGFLRRSLVELIFRYSQLEQDPMAILEESPRSKSRTLVNRLQKMSLINMPKAFKDRVRVVDGVGGEGFDKVRHIPSIIL